MLMLISVTWNCFNPRICKRCDCPGITFYFLGKVSIHASVKDATISDNLIDHFFGVSIHASVKDATVRDQVSEIWALSFNPRICKRCDLIERTGSTFTIVSIHASVKDATRWYWFCLYPCSVSIHASVKDATFRQCY